ncbi:hypothetical protein Tco_1029816 [Tanacetum coccineum]|uniref:Uncharacterized protein n=1 Tax=Tanacetum coccineum TaxID=301880 RepID=A0ABQ5G5W4_9ASTR
MSTQQNIYAAGFENRPPMLNKENYVPWSSCLFWYAKSRPNGKLIYNSMINGPYTDDELAEKELKQVEADDQAIHTNLLGLPEDIYAAVDSCETAQKICDLGMRLRINEPERILMANLQQASTSGKQITALNEEISNLNNQLSKEKSTVSSLQEEKKRLKSDFKIREDELLDKQIQLENKIKELDNILVKTGQSIQTMHMLSPKPDSFYHTEQKMALGYQNPFYLKQAQQKQQSLYNGKVLLEKHDPPAVYDSEETLQLAQESRLKMKQLNKEIKLANYTKINHLSGVFVSQTAKSQFSDDTTPSVARKFLNEVKSTIVTLQRVVKQKMTLDIHNWSSSVHQEVHKIVKDEIFPIINQVDARLQNFEIQFLKEAVEFIRDFKSLAKEADESLVKHKALELEIERLLRAVVSQDIMSIVQNPSVVDSSNLQTELDRTKERFENCIIKKENEYAKLWNDWYKKCEECKYDKISYDKAYNDMQQKIERFQAQLGDQKGKSNDTPCVSNTLDPLSQKLENENVELEFQNDKSKVVCAMCKQCLITANHDVCVLNYVNDINSRGKKPKANVSNTKNQKKQKPKVMKPKKVGSGTDIKYKDKNKTNTDKTKHGNGKTTLAIPHSLIGGKTWHMIQWLRMIDIEAVWNQWVRLEVVDAPEALNPSS